MTLTPIAVVLGLLLVSQAPVPRFEDYPVVERFDGAPVPVDLSSSPRARTFRTRLRTGAAHGPNFAGHYTVVTWRAGTPYGAMLAIVDARNGHVVFGPDMMFGAEYRLESQLLILDPPDQVRHYFEADSTDPLRNAAQTRYYRWDGSHLVPLDSALVYPRDPM